MIDTTTLLVAFTFVVGTTAAFLLGYLYGCHDTIMQLAREINERNTQRKADWLKHQR